MLLQLKYDSVTLDIISLLMAQTLTAGPSRFRALQTHLLLQCQLAKNRHGEGKQEVHDEYMRGPVSAWWRHMDFLICGDAEAATDVCSSGSVPCNGSWALCQTQT